MLGKQTYRMQNGMMYNDLDPELMQARQRTMALTTAYDQSYSQSPAKREALLAKILGKIGKNVHFEPTFRCEFGKNISIGAGVHIDQGVTIGDNTVIGAGSVVTHDIPADVVAYGVPCQVARKITAADKTGYDPAEI